MKTLGINVLEIRGSVDPNDMPDQVKIFDTIYLPMNKKVINEYHDLKHRFQNEVVKQSRELVKMIFKGKKNKREFIKALKEIGIELE